MNQFKDFKALTISQPFAKLIADGEKFVENRGWPTHYRGRLAIHAGLGTQYMSKVELKAFDTGAIVAIADLIACVKFSSLANMEFARDTPVAGSATRLWRHVMEHKHTEGPYCWILDNVRKLSKPIAVKGAQGLWTLKPELVTELSKV